MKKTSASQSAFFNPRVLLGFVLCSLGLLLALLGFSVYSSSPALAQAANQAGSDVIVGASYHNDVSPALRDVQQGWPLVFKEQHEANPNPLIPNQHQDSPDAAVQNPIFPPVPFWHPRYPGQSSTSTASPSPASDVTARRPIPMARWDQRSSFKS